MDIYQIFTAYNNPWSHREILFFSGILIFAVIVVSYYIRKEKLNKLQADFLHIFYLFVHVLKGTDILFLFADSTAHTEWIEFHAVTS